MNRSKKRRGAVTVELAFAIPILFLFVFASLEFCGMNNLRHTVDNAAYEGARRGIVPGATRADVVAEATRLMATIGARGVIVDVVPATITDETEEVTVTVRVPVAANGWTGPLLFDSAAELVGQCSMLREEY